jgi:hypothetical protein
MTTNRVIETMPITASVTAARIVLAPTVAQRGVPPGFSDFHPLAIRGSRDLMLPTPSAFSSVNNSFDESKVAGRYRKTRQTKKRYEDLIRNGAATHSFAGISTFVRQASGPDLCTENLDSQYGTLRVIAIK